VSVISRWRDRLRTRRGLLRRALRTGNVPLIHRRADQVKEAQRVIARHASKRLDPAALQRVAPWLTAQQARGLADALGPAFARYGIVTPRRAAAAVAQFAHESAGFHTTTEYASGAEYEGRRDLGNTHPGDGRRFKGRGYIQVTGRNNYAAAARAFGVDFLAHPEKLAEPRYAALVSCWWWAAHGCNQLADGGDFVALTRRINGGTNGLASREAYHDRARAVASRLVPKEA
jgi:predicted chitinase